MSGQSESVSEIITHSPLVLSAC